jgi:hypothetical protein
MVVEIAVAWVSLALTAESINAVQSMLVEVDEPDVVTELDDALDVVPVLVALLTVIVTDPSQRKSGRHQAGPHDPASAQQLEQVLRHLVRRRFR